MSDTTMLASIDLSDYGSKRLGYVAALNAGVTQYQKAGGVILDEDVEDLRLDILAADEDELDETGEAVLEDVIGWLESVGLTGYVEDNYFYVEVAN